MKSVGQWASKLLAVKVEVLKKKSATLAIPAEVCALCKCDRPGSRLPGVNSFSKFDGQWILPCQSDLISIVFIY